jgi:magnesium chelatase subunit H
LLAPLHHAEREINREQGLGLQIAAHNLGAALNADQWCEVEADLAQTDVVFVIHVMDGENAARLLPALEKYKQRHHAVIVINCMPDLMRRTRMGKLDFARFPASRKTREDVSRTVIPTGLPGRGPRHDPETQSTNHGDQPEGARSGVRLLGTVSSWIGKQARAHNSKKQRDHSRYLKLVDRLPAMLRFVPGAGALRDVKNYLYLFCYFLQPTPANIRSMVMLALKEYVPDERLKKIKIASPEKMPSVAIYHPDAPSLFERFDQFEKWYVNKSPESKVQGPKSARPSLDPEATIGLLLMRPQVISKTTKHYDELIRAIEAEGLSVIPVLATLMDNREACERFFLDDGPTTDDRWKKSSDGLNGNEPESGNRRSSVVRRRSRVSQLVSLTGFSFVGGPAMNDSEAAAEFLQGLNRPYRSAVSLDMQSIESWLGSQTGLNPVQAGMQIAIPEIDGATEPFVYGGLPAGGVEPVALEDRCARFAKRLRRWNRLRTAARAELKVALVLYCFPPNKGNIGTAADLDVFPSLWATIKQLQADGYTVDVPASVDQLREMLLGGNSEMFGATANIAYRMNADEYRRLCPYVDEIETDWGPAPGRINSFGNDVLIQGVTLGNVFIGVQPTFGYEGDPMRLMMARSGAPHHGFMAFYTYLSRVFRTDALVHVGTHGSTEFMPGKQVGLSGRCWPDRLIGDLPNIYIYSVNNPSEGSIAKRRSYAELISYLTPPIENAGLYKDLVTLKDLVMAYRQATAEGERERLFDSIEGYSHELNFVAPALDRPAPSAQDRSV